MTGERNMTRNGYRWDVFADFLCNTASIRVGTRKTKRGANHLATTFEKINHQFGVEHVYVKLRHDPLLDEVMCNKAKRR